VIEQFFGLFWTFDPPVRDHCLDFPVNAFNAVGLNSYTFHYLVNPVKHSF